MQRSLGVLGRVDQKHAVMKGLLSQRDSGTGRWSQVAPTNGDGVQKKQKYKQNQSPEGCNSKVVRSSRRYERLHPEAWIPEPYVSV